MVLPAKQAFLWLSWAHCYIFLSLYSRAGLLFLVQSLSLWCASYLIQDSLQNTFKAVAQRVCETKLLIENRLWYVLFQAGWAQFPAECWVCPGQNFSEGMLAVRYFWFLHSAVWAYVMAVLATSIGMTSFFFSFYCFQKFACHYIQNYHFFLSRVSSYAALSAPSAVLDNCPLLLCASPSFSAAVHHPSLAIIRWVKTDLSI